MEALQALPGWAQFFLALVVGGLLLLLNVGWLMQARGWLEAAKQKQRAGRPGASGPTGSSSTTAGTSSASPSPTTRPDSR
jgi:hypothetical protein